MTAYAILWTYTCVAYTWLVFLSAKAPVLLLLQALLFCLKHHKSLPGYDRLMQENLYCRCGRVCQ
jgi:hypothetical protein